MDALQGNDKRKRLYDNLVKSGKPIPDYDTFTKDMADDTKRQRLYDNLSKSGRPVPDYNTFSADIAGDLKPFLQAPTPSTAPPGVVAEPTGADGGVAVLPPLSQEPPPDSKLVGGDIFNNPAVQELNQGFRGLDATYTKPSVAPTFKYEKPRIYADQGGWIQQPDGTLLDIREQRLQEDFQQHGGFTKTQYTPEREKAMREAGTWSAQDELRKTQQPLVVQGNVLRKRREELDKQAEEIGFDRISAEMESIKAQLEQQQDPQQYNQLAEAYNRNLSTIKPILDEQRDLDEGMNYVKSRFAESEKVFAADPDVQAAKGAQAIADEDFKYAQEQVKKGNILDPEVIDQYVIRPMSTTLTSGLFKAAAALGRTVDAIGNTGNTVMGNEPVYSPLAAAADNLTAAAKEIAPTPSQVQEPMFDKDWNLNNSSLLPKMMQAATYMGMLAVPGRAAGEGGMMAASYALTEDDYYREGISRGLRQSEAQAFSMSSAIITSLLEKVNPGPLLNGKTVKGAMMERASKALRDGADWRTATNEGAKYVIKEGLLETGQETLQTAGDDLVSALTNLAIGDDKLDATTSAQEYSESALLGLAMGTLAATGAKAADRSLHAQTLDWAVRNRQKVEQFIEQSGSPQAKQMIEKLRTLDQLYTGNELKDMPADKSATVATLIQNKNAVEQQIREAPMDPVLEAAKGDPRKREAAKLTTDMIEALGIPANKAKAALASSGLEQMPEGTKAITNPDGSVTLEKKPEAGEKKKSKAVESVMTETATEETTGAPTGVPEGGVPVTPEAAIEKMSATLADKNAGLRVEEGGATGVTYAETKGGPAAGYRQPVFVTNKDQVAERLQEVADRMKGSSAEEISAAQNAWVDAATEEEQHHIDQQSDGTMDGAEEKWNALPRKVRQVVELLYDRNAFDDGSDKKTPQELWAEYDRMRRQVEAGSLMTEEALYGSSDPIAARLRQNFEPTTNEGPTAITETPAEATTDPGAAPSVPLDTPAPETPVADGEVIPQGPPDVPQDVQQDVPVEPQQVKKTLTTKRAYEGAFREEVKAELEKSGLYREVENQAEAEANADAFIAQVGIDAALDAARAGDVRGGMRSVVRVRAMEALDQQISESEDPAELAELSLKQSELIQETSQVLLEGGREAAMMARLYAQSDLGFQSEVKADEWRRQFGEEPSPEMMAKWKERDKEFEELRIKLDEAQKRAEEAEEKATIKAIKDAATREKARDRKRTYTEKSKALADQFRKLKAKPMTFRDADGNQIEVKQMGFDWNGLVEIGAKAIEKTGEIADGIAAIAEKLKDSSFFNSMDDRNKQAILQQIEDAYRVSNEEDVDVGPIRVPKKMIRDAVEDGANDIASLVSVIKEQLSDVYPNATDREIRDAITEYGKVVSMSKDELSADIRRIKRIGRITSALEDVQNKKRPLRSGLQRDKLDSEERALNKQLRDALKELPIDAEAEARELRTALDAAKTRTRNRVEDLQREIDAREKLPRNTRTIQPDAELNALIEERDALQKVHDEVFNDPEAIEEERLARAIDAARRAVENYEKRIRDKNLDPKKPSPVKETPELKAIRQQLTSAKAEYQKLQEDAGVIEKRKLETAKKVATQRIQDLERRIKEGDFSRTTSKPVIKDDELTKLLAQKVRLKEEYDKEFFKHKLANRSMPEKWKDAMWEAWGLTRALQATAELSFVLMQGGAMTISNVWHKPAATARAFGNMRKAFASQSKSEEWLRKVKAQEWYPIAKEAKLAITEPSGEMSAREELFLSDWARLIWDTIGRPFKLKSEAAYERWKAANPLKALERASVAYLDTLRVERFLDGLDILEKNKQAGEEVTKQDYKDIADAINTLTGRASIGKAEAISSVLTKLVFSPRLWASTVKTGTPYALIHFGKMTPTAQKMAVQDMGRFVGTTMGVVAMAAAYLNNDDDDGTGVEMDPRSADFGKIKIGNTRIDPWGGRIQQVVFSTKLTLGAMSLLRSPDISPLDSKAKQVAFLTKLVLDPAGLLRNRPLNAHKDPKTGKLYPLGVPFKSPNMMEVVTRMATNKLAPSASLVADAMNTRVDSKGNRKDAYGKDFDLQQRAMEKLVPIYYSTVKDLMKDDPNSLAGYLLFYAFFGGGVQTYEGKTNKTSGPTAAERLEAMRESR